MEICTCMFESVIELIGAHVCAHVCIVVKYQNIVVGFVKYIQIKVPDSPGRREMGQ